MNKKRINRISEETKRILSDILANDLKDPRISTMTSIVSVEVTNDLRYAKIFVSVLGDDKEKEDTIEGLKSAKGYVRKELGNRLDIRYTPEPIFYLDQSIEYGIYMSELIDKVKKEDEKRGNKDD